MKKGYALVLAAVSIWAVSSGILVKYITVSPFALYAIGACFGIIYLLINLAIKHKLSDLLSYPRKTLALMLLVGLGIAINNGLFFAALKSGSVANAVLSHNLAPVLVAFIFAPMLLKEKLTPRVALLAAISFVGLFILSVPGLGKSLDIALLFGALSAIFYALHTVLEKKVTQTSADPLSAVLFKNLVPLLIYSPFAIQTIAGGVSLRNCLLIIVWGVFVLGISFTLFFNGIKKIPASSAAILGYGEPVGAILLALIFFHQDINQFVVMGGLLIVLSGYFIVQAGHAKSPKLGH